MGLPADGFDTVRRPSRRWAPGSAPVVPNRGGAV